MTQLKPALLFCSKCEHKTPCILAYERTLLTMKDRPYMLCTRCGNEVDLKVNPWTYGYA